MGKRLCDVKDCERRVQYLCAACDHSLCVYHKHDGIIKDPCPRQEYKN